ncbi:MAG: GNAT family N-acetyltransferase [Paraclostridium sp.]
MKNLHTDRLLLREWKMSDSKDVYEYAQSELVGPNAGWPPHESEEKSKEIIKQFIESQEVYAIVLKSENKVVGSIGIHDRVIDEDLRNLNQRMIGYVINHNYWGNGIAPEACKCVLEYGFNELDLDLIWCAHYDFNEKSKRVIEKSGFTYRFSKKNNLTLLDNKEVTSLYYNISKDEYLNKE